VTVDSVEHRGAPEPGEVLTQQCHGELRHDLRHPLLDAIADAEVEPVGNSRRSAATPGGGMQ
jgi:hypothetical protein